MDSGGGATDTRYFCCRRHINFRLLILAGEIILCVAHGTSLRGIVKHLEDLTPEEICERDLPNGIPIVYRSYKMQFFLYFFR